MAATTWAPADEGDVFAAVRRLHRQTSPKIGLRICSRICATGNDGRPKKRCFGGLPSTGYQGPDSQIPPRHRAPRGYAFLIVCAKPVRGPWQTWQGLSPNSIDPSSLGIGKADAAVVCFWPQMRSPARSAVPALSEEKQTRLGHRETDANDRALLASCARSEPLCKLKRRI